MLRNVRRKIGVTLLETLVALTILSTILLPIGMFLIEYLKGSNELGNMYQVINLMEEKLETALQKPFVALPVGELKDRRISHKGKEILDLRPASFGDTTVFFSLIVELVPVEFCAIADSTTGELERSSCENGFKRLTLKAIWGDKKQHSFDLVAYKADL